MHLFGHLLRNKIAEIIVKIARKIQKFREVLDNQNFYSNLMFFKIVVFMKKSTKNNLFLNKIATYPQSCIKLHKILAQNLFF